MTASAWAITILRDLPLLIGAVGAAIALWALVKDRARGRMRCPKCWYDRSESPEGPCPECGRVVKSTRALQRTRRRWPLALLGIGLLIAAYPARVAIHAQQVGWPAALPSFVLVRIAPIEDGLDAQGIPNNDSLLAECIERGEAYRFSPGEWRILLRRMHDAQPLLVQPTVLTRSAWRAGDDAYFVVIEPLLLNGDWRNLDIHVEGVGVEVERIDCRYRCRVPADKDIARIRITHKCGDAPVWSREMDVFHIVSSDEPAWRPLPESDELTAAFRTKLAWSEDDELLLLTPRHAKRYFFEGDLDPHIGRSWKFGARVEVRRRGELVAEGAYAHVFKRPRRPHGDWAVTPLTILDDRARGADWTYELTIRSDPTIPAPESLNAFIRDEQLPPGGDYWDGVIESTGTVLDLDAIDDE